MKSPSIAPLPPTPVSEIAKLCEAFESQWSENSSPNMEDYLSQISEQLSSTLLRNLLQVELRLRNEAGEKPTPEEYLARYPQFAEVIAEEFQVHHSTVLVSMVQDTVTGGEATREPQQLPQLSRLGDYVLEKELGRGAMGIVFAANHVSRGHTVALKTLPTVEGAALQRFKQEFRSLSLINHPNLVGLHTLQEDGGQWFFTMDVIEGVEFLDHVRPEGQLDLVRLRSALSQIALGVHALHQHGILHRDLKPSNVMVSPSGQVHLLDFGLVVDLTSGNRESEIAGTPAYMAPEQFLGQATAASDWYAVGVMLYQALAGRLPFQGTTNEIFNAKQNSQPIALASHAPEDFGKLCEALLHRDPAQRPNVSEVFTVVCPTELPATSHAGGETSSEHLLGREKQIAQIRSSIEEFGADTSPATIFISGKSGEGKTVLAEHFLNEFRQDDRTIVLSGRCYDRESVPFKAIDTLIDALCSRLLAMPETDVEAFLAPDVAVLAQLFPVLTRVKPIARLETVNLNDVEAERVRRLASSALKTVFRGLAAHARVICFIDDLQWGDADSAELLFDMLHAHNAPQVLFFGTYRSDEAVASRFLQAWQSKRQGAPHPLPQTDCEVGPLNEEECIELVVNIAGVDNDEVRKDAAEIAVESGGNPLLLLELADVYDPHSTEAKLLHIEDILHRKLTLLPSDAQALLEIISVSGKALSLQEVLRSLPS